MNHACGKMNEAGQALITLIPPLTDRLREQEVAMPQCKPIPELSPEELERFWVKVDRSGGPEACWPWRAALNHGYGVFSINRRTYLAHRVSWALVNGPVPDGLLLCHDCPGGDDPSCCNPGHHFLGDQKANMSDALAKGRIPRGDNSPSRLHPETRPRGEQSVLAKLTEEDVRAIRRMCIANVRHRDIAEKFGISRSHVGEIAALKEWRHVSPRVDELDDSRPSANARRRKISEAQIVEIRQRYAAGDCSYRSLAPDYGVSAALIQLIIEGKSWFDQEHPGTAPKKPYTGKPIGEFHRNARLNAATVREIRHRSSLGETQDALSAALGVAQSTISRVICRQAWGHVEDVS